jgi:hypothetical protein
LPFNSGGGAEATHRAEESIEREDGVWKEAKSVSSRSTIQPKHVMRTDPELMADFKRDFKFLIPE